MKSLGLIMLAFTIAASALARLGETEGDFNRKFVYARQSEDFEGERKVGPFFSVKKRLYVSKERDVKSRFVVAVTFVNGISQHENYQFDRKVNDIDIEAMKAANGGVDKWTEADKPVKGVAVFTRKDGKATIKAVRDGLIIELFSDVYIKLQQQDNKAVAPRF